MQQAKTSARPHPRRGSPHRRRRSASARRDYNYFRDYEPGTGRYVESDRIGLQGGLSTYGYADQSPLLGTDATGMFTTYATQNYNGQWNFRFEFHGRCVLGNSPIDHLDNLFQRGVPYLGRVRREQVRRQPQPTGDADAMDKCACRQFDPHLEQLFRANGWDTGDAYGGQSYTESQARSMLDQMRTKVDQLNKGLDEGCNKCSMPWEKMIDRAKGRGTPFIGNGVSR